VDRENEIRVASTIKTGGGEPNSLCLKAGAMETLARPLGNGRRLNSGIFRQSNRMTETINMPRITDPDEICRVAKEALQAADKATERGECFGLTLEAYCAIADMIEMEKLELNSKRATLANVRKRLQAREVSPRRVRELRQQEAVLKREITELEARTKREAALSFRATPEGRAPLQRCRLQAR